MLHHIDFKLGTLIHINEQMFPIVQLFMALDWISGTSSFWPVYL